MKLANIAPKNDSCRRASFFKLNSFDELLKFDLNNVATLVKNKNSFIIILWYRSSVIISIYNDVVKYVCIGSFYEHDKLASKHLTPLPHFFFLFSTFVDFFS